MQLRNYMYDPRKFLILSFFLLTLAARGQEEANRFRWSGRMSDNGTFFSGLMEFRWKVFNLPTGGTQVGSDVVLTNILTNGNFSVIVDLSQGPYVNGQTYWIEAAVRYVNPETGGGPDFTNLSPRKDFRIGTAHGIKMFRQPGTNDFIVPAGVHQILVEAWAGGGAGAGVVSDEARDKDVSGSGGGGGGYARGFITVSPGATNVIIVGAGGAAGSNYWQSGSTSGSKGGDTEVLSAAGTKLLRVTGGWGGTNTYSGSIANHGGSGGLGDTNTSINMDGQPGSGGRSVKYDNYSNAYYPGGNGGKSATGSAQPGGFVYVLDGFSYDDRTDTYDTSWTRQDLTFGHGGWGAGADPYFGWFDWDSYFDRYDSARNGTDGCIIIQW
jgi:hypothetical protein